MEITLLQPISLLSSPLRVPSDDPLGSGRGSSGQVLTISRFIICVLAPDERLRQCWRFT
jgi:hypothetical protein